MEMDGRLDILVVEDEPDALSGLLDLLETEGFAVAGAHDGQEALSLLKEGPTPSLVLLDLTMPTMDGWEFCRALEESDLSDLADVPIAVFTGVDIDTVSELPDRRYDAGFIQKPVEVTKLLELARRYCAVAER
jgi:CheY-like chemotaxis protein